MNILSLTLYELKTRFRLYIAWKAIIIVSSIGLAWICWQAAIIGTGIYLAVAGFLAPEGQRVAGNNDSSFSIFGSGKPQYAWNMPTYHQGSGKVLATKELPQGTVKIYQQREGSCYDPPCYKYVAILKEAENYAVPTPEEVKGEFSDVIGETLPHEYYGHTPYRRPRDLISYHYDTSLFYGSFAQLTGFGWYDPDYSEKTKEHVKQFLAKYGRQSQTLYCSYKNEGDGKWSYVAAYWYKQRPPESEHSYLRRNFGSDHPLLDVRDPVDACPARFVEK